MCGDYINGSSRDITIVTLILLYLNIFTEAKVMSI